MLYKPCFLLLAILGLNTWAWSQPGFNRIYDATIIGNKSFDKVFVDQDTIFALGVGYQLNSPQGLTLAKIDSFGNLVAQNLILDPLGDHLTMDFLWGNVIKTSQGYYAFPAIALGRGARLLIQIDQDLQVKSIFEFSLPTGDLSEFDNVILETQDGGFLIVGDVQRPNLKLDGFMRRIDSLGNLLWFKYLGGYLTGEYISFASQVDNNRFLLSGGGQAKGTLWLVDSIGVLLEQKNIQAPNLTNIGDHIRISDGGFIAEGSRYLGEGEWGSKIQPVLMKFDSTLQLEWLKNVGPSTSNFNTFLDLAKTLEGQIIAAGSRTAYGDPSVPGTDWGGWLFKFSEQGDSIWSRADNAPLGYDATGGFQYGGVGILSSGSIVAGGLGEVDNKLVGWVVKVTADGCMDTLFCQTSKSEEVVVPTSVHLSPNPANNAAQIRFAQPSSDGSQLLLCDLAGRILLNQQIPAGVLEQTIQLSEYPSGWYFVTLLENGRVVLREKLVVIR
jgi:hypothetical protein